MSLEQYGLEERYIVLKLSDLSMSEERDIRNLIWDINVGRLEDKRPELKPRECVVVESDWPIFKTVTEMVLSLSGRSS